MPNKIAYLETVWPFNYKVPLSHDLKTFSTSKEGTTYELQLQIGLAWYKDRDHLLGVT